MKKRDFINVSNQARISDILKILDQVLTGDNAVISSFEIDELKLNLRAIDSRLFSAIEYKD